MKAVWNGYSSSGPATNATNFHYLTGSAASVWSTADSAFTDASRTVPLSDDVTITKLTVYVTTAPGSGKSWAFSIRDDGVATAATVTISGTSTSATWTGSAAIAALSLTCVQSVPTSAPAASGAVYWNIEYTTAGNFYLLPTGMDNYFPNGSVTSYIPIGTSGTGNGSPSTTATDWRSVVPTACTVVRASLRTSVAGGTTTFALRKNNTTDSSTYLTITNPATVASGSQNFSLAAGDLVNIKIVASGGAWTFFQACLSIEPSSPGEIIQTYTLQTNGPSTTATNYESGLGRGAHAAWNATEANVQMRLAACQLKNLYVILQNATGAARSRAFTLRSATTDTTVTTTITNGSAGNTTSQVALHPDGGFFSVKSVPTGTPAASAVGVSFVQIVAQPEAKRNFLAAMNGW